MAENLAQGLSVALELVEEVFVIARLEVKHWDILEQLLNILLVLFETLAVPHDIRVCCYEAFEVRLLMGTQVNLDRVLVVGIT